jgi:hypothetical protein
LNHDGTGYFSFKTLHSDACLQRVKAKTREMKTKNDCERNAVRRLLEKLRQGSSAYGIHCQ